MPAQHGDFNNDDDEPTRPESPKALLARTLERFRSSAESICRAIPMLELLDGTDREYFAARLREDINEFCDSGRDLGAYVCTDRTR